MIERQLQDTLESQLRGLIQQGRAKGQEAQRRQARLAKIIQDFYADGCYTHGEACPTLAECLADEIISRMIAWV